MIEQLKRVDRQTRVQYGLMIVFGGLCLVAALAPLDDLTRTAAVGTTFGFTAGLWVSHLIGVLQRAAEDSVDSALASD
ncbi:hypothetical protein BRC68_02995 [Halobacteriales archaeon QH_6_64_20]|jgi:hypothetical protein|nr:MAG: hypothetical protein BRC68_02995 [Halobacteriales archaeon QH_6_64_20]